MLDQIDNDVIAAVRSLYGRDDVAKKFLDWCAEKKRDARETSIDRIMNVIDVSRGTAVALAKALEGAGCGEFIVGRRGSLSRFSWHYSRVSLGQIAAGEVDELEAVKEPVEIDDEDEILDVGKGMTILQAKQYLAESLGVAVYQIEIHIRA